MTPELARLLAVLVAVVIAVALGVYWWTQREPSAKHAEDEVLPLFGSVRPGERTTPPQGLPPIRPMAPPPTARSSWEPPLPPVVPFRAPPTPPEARPTVAGPIASNGMAGVVGAEPEAPRPAPIIREFSTGPTTSPPATGPSNAVVNAAGVPGTMVEGHGLRFSVPAEGTLQFLPGRFEIGSGVDAGREIRFVQVPGPNGMEVTFGRSEGELYRHIQLRDKTVSRQHARMHLREGRWYLVNLSHTNPVAYNGAELAGDQEQLLNDGDRIEMGEVAFTFRSR